MSGHEPERSEILALRAEAVMHGDASMAAVCDLAIEGDEESLEQVSSALESARAMRDRS